MKYKLLGEYIKEHPILGVFFDEEEYTKYSYKDLYVLTEEIIKYKVNMLAEFVYICHPLVDKKLSPRIEKFQSYLKPRFYITEEDFGYYFDGLKGEDEAIIDLFFKLYSSI